MTAQPGANSGLRRARTLAYDGFNTGTIARSYLNHFRLAASGAPTAGMIGFDATHGWNGATDHIVARAGDVRQLAHPLMKRTQPGALGHWTFDGTATLRRQLPQPPVARSGVYTLCLLYRAHDNPRCNLELTKKHTTNFPNAHAWIGFVSDDRGLALGYYEDDLRAFADGKSFAIVEGYREDTTYLLLAELTVSPDGPEHLRGFYAAEDDRELRPAPFNSENGGKGVRLECWSSPRDMGELRIHLADTKVLGLSAQASRQDMDQSDFITWDEVRLLDGPAAVPVGGDEPETALSPHKYRGETTKRLVSYWPFDERKETTVKDLAGDNHLTLKQARLSRHARFGEYALQFDDRDGDGSDVASLSYGAAEKGGLVFDSGDAFTISAWVRGEANGRWGGLNDIVTMSRSNQEGPNKLRDARGLAFSIANYRLRLSLISSVNFPKKDNRLTVDGTLRVPDNQTYHHVAVTYDGSGKSSGVAFYVNGQKDPGFSVNFEDMGHKLTGPILVNAPFNLGGRNDDSTDVFKHGFSGYIDDVAVFRGALSPGEVAAIHALAAERRLGYDLGKVNRLLELHRAQEGSVSINFRTWIPVPRGTLDSGLGRVEERDGFVLQLGPDGSGVRTK